VILRMPAIEIIYE